MLLALRQAGLAGKARFVGFDASPPLVEALRKGEIGALIMTVVDNGCTKLELANWVQEVVTGAIIVAAVGLDRLCQ